jgi:hypothetical protein
MLRIPHCLDNRLAVDGEVIRYIFRSYGHLQLDVMLFSDVFPPEDGRTTETCSG